MEGRWGGAEGEEGGEGGGEREQRALDDTLKERCSTFN